jgi:hypothetical protein
VSAAYRKAMQAGGQQTVNDYYANLRKDAEAYLANPNAPRGVEAYNVLLQSGISTSDLINAGVGQAVLDKIFAVQAPIKQEQFITPTGMTSAYERSPDLAFESQRLTAQGQDGRAILDKQGRDYITNLQQGGINATERAQMLEYATERGYSFDDLMKAGVDPNVLFTQPAAAAAPPIPGSALAPPVFPQTQPTYTPPTVYQQLPTQPDIFAAGQPALDTAFRESSPRTAILDKDGRPTGQFDYSPAAKLRPATGAGFTFTPPSVTSRPRSLLSPREIQAYGGMTSKSQQFAANRAAIDRSLRRLRAASPALNDPSTYALLRNQIMAQDFGNPQRVFDPKTGEVNLTTEEGQNFLKAVNALAAASPAEKAAAAKAATTSATAGTGSTGSTTQAGGYAAAIDGGDEIKYGGYDILQQAKGGLVKKSEGSAKDELARFANGGQVDAELLRRQLEGIDNTPTARTPEPATDAEVTESRSILDRLGQAGAFLNQGFYEQVAKPAVGAAVDMTVGLGDLAQMGARYLGDRAGMDTGEFTPAAPRVREALGVEGYDPYAIGSIATQILPFAAAGRTAVSAPTAARQLEAMFPNLGRETGAYVAGETGAAAAREIAPDSMLAEVAGAALGSTGASMAMGSPTTARMVDSTERTYQHRPTSMNPFVGRLDRFIGTELEGTTTLPALVNRLRGKFRGYDIQRVEEIAKGVDPSAKFKPNEILDMLRVNYDPSAFQVQQRPVKSSYSFYTQDDPFAGEPDSALERSVIMLNRDNMPQNAVSSKAAEFAKDSIDRLSVMRLVASSGAGDDISNILRGNTLARYTAPLVDFLSYNRGSSFDNEVMPIIARLDRDVTEFQEMQETLNTSINEFSPQNFFKSPSFSSALRESKRRQEAEGGVNPRQILKQAEMEAFHSTYEGLVNSYLSLAPDMRQLFENLENPQYVTENEQIIPFLTDNAIPKLQKSLARETRRLESTIKDSFLDIADNQGLQNALKTASAGKMPGSNPLYAGRHQSLTPGVSNLISLTRATDVKADIPGMGNNVKGIYLHELQSDLVNDIRKAGGPRNMTPEQLQERLGQTEAVVKEMIRQRDLLAEEQARLLQGVATPGSPVPPGLQQRALGDPQVQAENARLEAEIDAFRERIDSQKRVRSSIESRLAGLPPRFGALADEPFVGASDSPRVLQQLMIKAAVKAAVDRGLNFVALTSPEKSKEAQLYAMTPQNAKDVIKDLGEGFVLQKLDISSPSGQTGFSTMGIVWDQQDAAGREALNRMYTQGVPFKEGGLVDSKVADEVLRSQEELLREQLARIDNTPSTRTPERAPTPEQTESRTMLERISNVARGANQAFYENVSKPAVGTVIDMTLGLGDLVQMGARYLGNRAGMDAGEFTSVAQPAKEALGVEDYNPYSVGGLGASILPFATAGRAAAATTRAVPGAMLSPTGSPSAARQLSSMFPNIGRETGAYIAGETGAAAATAIAPDSALAEIGGSLVAGTGASMALGPPPTARAQMAEITQRAPTVENPFVGRLDAFVSGLQGRTTLPNLVNQIQGKLRDYDVARVKRIMRDVPADTKFTSAEILEKLQANYNPANFRVTQITNVPNFYEGMDNPWSTDSVQPRHSTIVLSVNDLGGGGSPEAAKDARDGLLRLDSDYRIMHDSDPTDYYGFAEYYRPLVKTLTQDFSDLSRTALATLGRIEDRIRTTAENVDVMAGFEARMRQEAIEPTYFDTHKNRLLEQGGVPAAEVLSRAYANAFQQRYDQFVTRLRSRLPEIQRLNELPVFKAEDYQGVPADRINEAVEVFLGRNVNPLLQSVIREQKLDSGAYISEQEAMLSGNQELRDFLTERAQSARFAPGSNPTYLGQHPAVTGKVKNHVSFSRASDVTANIPEIGPDARGIYVHELQSDLLDDMRTTGGPRSLTTEELIKRRPELENSIEALDQRANNNVVRINQLKKEHKDRALSVEQRYRMEQIPMTEEEVVAQKKALEAIKAIEQENYRLYQRRSGINIGLENLERRVRGDDVLTQGVMVDEAFAGMDTNPKALQQLMIKAAVKAAVDRSLDFVALTSPQHSAQSQLYERIPQNARDVVKDLGEGFQVRQVELQSGKGPFTTTAIVWGRDASGREGVNRLLTQGVPFKEGGEVSSAKHMLDRLTSAR